MDSPHGSSWSDVDDTYSVFQDSAKSFWPELTEAVEHSKGMLEFWCNHAPIRKLAQQVVVEYGVKVCVLSLVDSDGCIGKAACFNCDLSLPWRTVALHDTQMFKILVKRAAPIIVKDMEADESRIWKRDPLVVRSDLGIGVGCKIRFFVELPLRAAGLYCGTICLVDDKPNEAFQLSDAEYLVEKASELVNTIKESNCFDKSASIL